MIKEVYGNIIDMAINGKLDVIAHGCNCFNMQGAGLAAQMSDRLGTHLMKKEQDRFHGDINKLGTIDYGFVHQLKNGLYIPTQNIDSGEFAVVNAYTQYQGGRNGDYSAVRLCLKKIAHEFGEHYRIGLPLLGCGIAGLDEEIFIKLVEQDMKDCKDVTIVRYKK